MPMRAEAFVNAVWGRGLAPDPQITVSEWADKHRMLPQTAAEPGRWRTSRTPYLREAMDALSPSSPTERVVVMAGAQVGKTECGLNFIGAAIHNWPGLMLFVQPTVDAVRRTVRTRIDPLIEATPELANRIVKPGPRKAGNSAFFKGYPGGALACVGANSGVGLRSTPARFVLLDEVDAYPHDAGGDGDPVQLAIARTATFRGRRKILLTSTPTIEGISRIAAAYAESDQRKFHWPCPHCEEAFVAEWEHVHWPEGDPGKAYMACPSCGGIIEERDKAAMVRDGRWKSTATGDGRTAGFHVSGLISPFVTWAEIAADFVAAGKDPLRMQVWTNNNLGLPYEDRDTAPLSADVLQSRAVETDPSWIELLPEGVTVITAGADVQADRIEVEFVGWGAREENWSLDYQIVFGDPSRPEVWTALDQLLLRRFRHPRAVPDLPVSAGCIDAGYIPDRVHAFAHPRTGRRVWPTKGRGGPGIPPWPKRPPRPRRDGVPPTYIVGVDTLKTTLMARLRSGEECHFPADRDYWWFQGLVSERPIRKWTRGIPKIEWIVDPGVRNEPLDCRNYAAAALHGLYASGFFLDQAAAHTAEAPLRTEPDQESPPPAPVRRVVRSRYLGG